MWRLQIKTSNSNEKILTEEKELPEIMARALADNIDVKVWQHFSHDRPKFRFQEAVLQTHQSQKIAD